MSGVQREQSCDKAGTHYGIKKHTRTSTPLCVDCAAFKAEYERNRRTPAKVRIATEMKIRRHAVMLLIRRHRTEFDYLLLQARHAEAGRKERVS